MKAYIKAEVFSHDGNVLLATSNQISVQRDENNHVCLILKDLETSNLTLSRLVQIVAYTEKGIQLLKGNTSFLVDDKQANFVISEWSDPIERRENVKVSINVQSEIIGLVDSKGDLTVLEPALPIVVKNISVGGMLFFCKTNFAVGTKAIFTFMLRHVPFKISFTIVRQDDVMIDDMYVYGTRFDPLSPSIDSLLCSYIYQVQLNNKMKNADK